MADKIEMKAVGEFASISDFQKQFLDRIAGTLGVSYEQLSADFECVNRRGKDEAEIEYEQDMERLRVWWRKRMNVLGIEWAFDLIGLPLGMRP